MAPRSAAASSERSRVNGRAQLDEGQDLAAGHLDVAEGSDWSTGVDPPEVDGRELPAQRAGEVDQPPGGQVVLERAAGLVVDLRPGPVGDRGQLAHQMVHGNVLLSLRRLPMPRLPPVNRPAASWARGLGVGSPDAGQGVAVDVGEGLVPVGDVEDPFLLVGPGAVGVDGDAHPVAEGPEGLVEVGVGQDAVDLGADRGPDLELGGVGLGGPAGQQHLAPGDARG